MADAFILGAGFSRAVSMEMPLAADLPGIAIIMKILEHMDTWSMESLFKEPIAAAANGNFELILTYLSGDQPWLAESETLANRGRFLAFSEMIADVIAACQNDAIKSKPPKWFLHLMEKWCNDRSTVITLNYDTLVEQAYVLVEGVDGRFAHSSIYPIRLPSIALRSGGPLGSSTEPTMSLLKLHGSINWFYSGAPSYFGETIYDIGVNDQWPGEGELWKESGRELSTRFHSSCLRHLPNLRISPMSSREHSGASPIGH